MCLMRAASRLGIRAEEVRQILGGKAMDRFIGQEENFISDA